MANGNGKTVIAFGGGKGGTGKSFLTSNMGICLARRGKKVLLVDADFGGANLHSFLGIRTPDRCLTDFFENKISLDQLITPTICKGVGVLSGDFRSYTAGVLNHNLKLKFFRHVQKLEADYILLDLGAGSHHNTVDTFLTADKKILVINPDRISIENMYHFVKTCLIREVVKLFTNMGRKEDFLAIYSSREQLSLVNLRELIDYSAEQFGMQDLVADAFRHFSPYIIVNKIRRDKDMMVGFSSRSILRKYLGIHAQYIGFLGYDDHICDSINRGKIFIHDFPTLHSAEEVKQITENFMENRQISLKTSINGRKRTF